MIEVYLSFNGNAAQAAQYYADVFEAGAPHVMRFGDIPKQEQENLPEDMKDLVMHATVKTFAGDFMLSDNMPDTRTMPNQGIWISATHEDERLIRRAFDALAKDGEIIMPLEKTFFSPMYGQLKDKFGFYWMLMLPSPPPG
ncbi:MAG: VOC family protein [Clostridiales bacterium]|nr:VOC family protein [Clostridiales bacterium]